MDIPGKWLLYFLVLPTVVRTFKVWKGETELVFLGLLSVPTSNSFNYPYKMLPKVSAGELHRNQNHSHRSWIVSLHFAGFGLRGENRYITLSYITNIFNLYNDFSLCV